MLSFPPLITISLEPSESIEAPPLMVRVHFPDGRPPLEVVLPLMLVLRELAPVLIVISYFVLSLLMRDGISIGCLFLTIL